MNDHVAAAADIAGARIGHGEGKTGCHRRIHGVAAAAEYLAADAGGARFLSDHHPAAGDRGRDRGQNSRRVQSLRRLDSRRRYQSERKERRNHKFHDASPCIANRCRQACTRITEGAQIHDRIRKKACLGFFVLP
jgi:hypothetical protein